MLKKRLRSGEFGGQDNIVKYSCSWNNFCTIYATWNGYIVLLKDVTVIIGDCCHETVYLVFNDIKICGTQQNSLHIDRTQCYPNHHTAFTSFSQVFLKYILISSFPHIYVVDAPCILFKKKQDQMSFSKVRFWCLHFLSKTFLVMDIG